MSEKTRVFQVKRSLFQDFKSILPFFQTKNKKSPFSMVFEDIARNDHPKVH